MSTISSRFETVARVLPNLGDAPAESFGSRLSELYALSQKSNYVFASPLGPVFHAGRHLHVPRFVYFGPHTHDESLRLAFLAGFDGSDLRAAVALSDFIEQLVKSPDLGQGLNLSFFPLIDVLGLARGDQQRDLSQESWARPRAPEIGVLEKDARIRGYHGFIRLETSSEHNAISVRLRNDAADGPLASGIELVSSDDFEPWAVRWEADPRGAPIHDGPLTAVDDLPIRPFELTLRLPKDWTADVYQSAVAAILRRLILRHRALQAYSQHL